MVCYNAKRKNVKSFTFLYFITFCVGNPNAKCKTCTICVDHVIKIFSTFCVDMADINAKCKNVKKYIKTVNQM